jgi:oligoribonuclease NrnB/cAMP/cGMP phosphodiesterase (DHH superfamily)
MKEILFLYHDPCTDGFLCRVIAHCFYKQNPDPERNVTYVGVNPSALTGDLQRALEDNGKKRYDQILMFDVSLGPEHYAQLRAASDCVSVFDHHESTLKKFPRGAPWWLEFDNDRCGAHLAYRYFFGAAAPVPAIVRYVEVRDLWLFGTERDTLPASKEATTFLYAEPFLLPFQAVEQYEFLLLGDAQRIDDEYWQMARTKGAAKILEVDKAVDDILAKAEKHSVTLPDSGEAKTALVAEACKYVSEAGSKVATTLADVDFSLFWCIDEQNNIRLSLRSDGKRCNVNDIARQMWSGGGHAAAAGALITDAAAQEKFLHRFARRSMEEFY